MFSIGVLILSCIVSFSLGEIIAVFLIALLSANKEGDNDDKQ